MAMLQANPHVGRSFRLGMYLDGKLWYEVTDWHIDPEFHIKIGGDFDR